MSLVMALRSKFAYRTLVCHQHDLASNKISFLQLNESPSPAYKTFVLSSKSFWHCSNIFRKFTTFVCYYSTKKENLSMNDINSGKKNQDNFIQKSYLKLVNLIQPPAAFSKSLPIKTHHKNVLLNSLIRVKALEKPMEGKSTEEATFISENSKSEYHNITSNLNRSATDNSRISSAPFSHSINHSKIKYPLKVPSKSKPVKTELFEDMQNFLNCLSIPCEELEYYPDIQRMSNDDILDCLTMLKNVGIHKVFSLFLINSAHQVVKGMIVLYISYMIIFLAI